MHDAIMNANERDPGLDGMGREQQDSE